MEETAIVARTTSLWYVVHCEPFKESPVAALLEMLLGVPVYWPRVKRRFRGKVQEASLFSRYLFIYADLNQVPPSSINAIPGVVRLVTFDEKPQPIPTTVVQAIQQQVDDLNAQGGLPEHHLRPGDPVSITQGPLQGLEAVFIGPMKPRDRVQVLIDFLGQLRKAKIDIAMIESSSPTPLLKRERRTRGKGRRIVNNSSHNSHIAPEHMYQ